jgi:hypothetical protein
MPRVGGRRLASVAACALLALAGCGASSSNAGCGFTAVVSQAGTPLTLLGQARLDQVASAFLLLGADSDGAFVRWASVDPATGSLGAEQALAVPPHEGGPWFAAAGQSAPGDTVLVAYSLSAANNVDSQIVVLAAPADGSGPPAGPTPVATIIGGAGSLPTVAMGSSRLGFAGALAWIDTNAVKARVIAGTGQPVGPLSAAGTAASLPCLSFVPGKDELTLGFYETGDPTTTRPTTWLISEIRETGSLDSTLDLPVGGPGVGCPLQTPTQTGYALAWQDAQGSWLGTYETASNMLVESSFASASMFGGADLQPPLAGVAPMGTDFGVVLVRAASAEMWRLDAAGVRHPGQLVFPSTSGHMGGVASLALDGSLYATYADYTAMAADVGGSGQRYFLRASCE